MKCDRCRKEKEGLVQTVRDGKSVMICPDCVDASENQDDLCRCKETVGKSPTEVLKMVVKDMLGQKK